MDSSSSSKDQTSDDIGSIDWNDDDQTAKDGQAGEKTPDAKSLARCQVGMSSAMQLGQPKKETIAPAAGASVPKTDQPKTKRPDVWQSFEQIPRAEEQRVKGSLTISNAGTNTLLELPLRQGEVQSFVKTDEAREKEDENPVHNIPMDY